MLKYMCVYFLGGAEASPHHFGFEGGLDLSVGQAVPVNASEERLLPDIPFPLGPTAQPLGRVLGHQLRERERERESERERERERSMFICRSLKIFFKDHNPHDATFELLLSR